MPATTTRLTGAADGLPEGDTEPEGLGDGETLPDALMLGVGSDVGPGCEEIEGSGSPTVGLVPTKTTRTLGTARTGAEPAPGDDAEAPGAELAPDADGEGAPGPTVTVVDGGAPATLDASGMIAIATAAIVNPAAPTAYRYTTPACRLTAR